MQYLLIFLLSAVLLLSKPFQMLQAQTPLTFYVGTYTEKTESKGIYKCLFDATSGKITETNEIISTVNPSFLALHANNKWLFAVNETAPGSVSAFDISDENNPKLINTVPSNGDYPCYISIDTEGKFVFVANYGTGTISMYRINSDGSLHPACYTEQQIGSGPNKKRQEGPHAHMIVQDKISKRLFTNNLGSDKVQLYTINYNEEKLDSLSTISTASGAGPRHLAFSPGSKFIYVLNELNGTIEAYKHANKKPYLKKIQSISTLEIKENEAASADIHITPNGKFLYASNRAENNNIAQFRIAKNGTLTLLGYQSTLGKTPRNFAIDPTGKFLLVANQKTNNIIVFKINNTSGLLENTGIELKIPAPVCIQFKP